jgi:hypothetical protein
MRGGNRALARRTRRLEGEAELTQNLQPSRKGKNFYGRNEANQDREFLFSEVLPKL